jgi:hypothetical protein
MTQFNNTFNGAVGNVAQNSSRFSQTSTFSTPDELFSALSETVKALDISTEVRNQVLNLIQEMSESIGQPKLFEGVYARFTGFVADHVSLIEPVSKFIPLLASLLSS